MAAITLREAKSKKNTPILPDPTTYVPRALADAGGGGSSGGGDGGGDSGGSSGGTDSGGASAPSSSTPSESGGAYTNAGGYTGGGGSAGNEGYTVGSGTYAGWGGPGSPLYGTGAGGSGTSVGQQQERTNDQQAQGSSGAGGATSAATKSVPAELWNAQVAAGIQKANAGGWTDWYKNRLSEEQLAAGQSARSIAGQTYYQKLMQAQGAAPGGFGGSGSSSGGGRGGLFPSGTGTGTGGYSTGLIPPSTVAPLTIPVYDQGKVESLAQQVGAPGIKLLRDQVQKAQGATSDNPNVKALTLRQALQGYGSGLESVMGGALTAGAQMYGQEYNPQVAGATANYQGALQQAMQAASIAAQERIAAANRASQEKISNENRYAQAYNNWKAVQW